MKYIFASDPHGTGTKWIEKVNMMRKLVPTAKIVFGGDYIDGREYSLETLSFVKQLVEKDEAIALMGNHEDLMLKALKNFNSDYSTFEEQLWIHNGGLSTLDSIVGKNGSIYEKMNRMVKYKNDLINWIEKLPLFYTNDEIFFVHAGVDLNLKDPFCETQSYDMMWIREDYIYKPNSTFFAHNYTDKTIITGHTPTVFISGKYEGFDNVFRNDESCPVTIIKYPNERSRVFTDGGCHGKNKNNHGNVVLIESNGEILGVL